MQPKAVEWLGAVAFFGKDPKEVYFTCDIVHARLMQIVHDARKRGSLSDEYELPDVEVMAQAKTAKSCLQMIAISRGCSVSTMTTLGVSYTQSGKLSNQNHFYALREESSNSLIQAAIQYDPQIRVQPLSQEGQSSVDEITGMFGMGGSR